MRDWGLLKKAVTGISVPSLPSLNLCLRVTPAAVPSFLFCFGYPVSLRLLRD